MRAVIVVVETEEAADLVTKLIASTMSLNGIRHDWDSKSHVEWPLPDRAKEAKEALDRIDGFVWGDIGSHFTCSEVEAVADVLRALDHPGDAEALLDDHAWVDSEGDSHFVCGAHKIGTHPTTGLPLHWHDVAETDCEKCLAGRGKES